MEHRKQLIVPDRIADEMIRLLDEPDGDSARDEPLFDEEVQFDSGVRVAIQVIASTEPAKEEAWSQAVGFTYEGWEIGCSEASDAFLGEWFIRDGDNTYVVEVIKESDANGSIDVRGQEQEADSSRPASEGKGHPQHG